MNADPQAVQALFARAIEIADLAERKKFLADECSGNVELYDRVGKLLIAFDGSKGFLDQPSHDMATTLLNAGSGYQPGNVIAGRYKLLEAIGEGGMGAVWVAEQTQPVRRKVALKLVKPGMDSKQVLARFDAERQALALMDHPNIAKVFDGGVTDQGRPFFAMELVKGMPLTQYCDQMRLPVEERLKLFVPICQAVQHAHQKGVIHRDLKPSNVLICLYDGKPVPKVIDFGLAKAMHRPLTEQTVHTGFGMMIGTPLYMSPEQAEHNNLDVDTRTDVYSLGVMLYELLTGSTPLEKAQFKDAAFGEILRLIKEVEPPKPSTRVSSSAQLPNIAAQRNLDPDKLGRSMRGDLDWIVMKAIDKERDRRYETANGLARDIERFLNTEAVEACPPSTSYRLRRLARKHRTALATAAAFAAILVTGAVLSGWQAYRATSAESLASQRLAEVQIEQRKTQQALDASQQSERLALESKADAVAAREAEELAKSAEAQQRKLAEQQRDEAQRLQVEATAKSSELETLTEQQRRAIYAAEMSQVSIEAQRGNLVRMREILLNQLPIDDKPDLRGFEWNYWYRYLNQAKVLNRFEKPKPGQKAPVAVVAPGGEFVLVARGKTKEFVNTTTGEVMGTAPTSTWGGRGYTSISGRLVSGINSQKSFSIPILEPVAENYLRVWDPSGKNWKIEYPPDSFSHVSWLNISPDGSIVGALGRDVTHQPDRPASRLMVWNVATQELILNHLEHRELNGFSFSPNSRQVAAWVVFSSRERSDERRDCAIVVDIETGETRGVIRHDDDIEYAWWLPDSKRVLLPTLGFSGANRRQLLSWSPEDASPRLLSPVEMPNYVRGCVSPDGRTLAVSGPTFGSILLIDTERGNVVDSLHHEGSPFDSLTFSSDGNQVIATSITGQLLSWDLDQNQDLFKLRANPLEQLCYGGATLNQEQTLLAIAYANGAVGVRNRDGQETVLCPAASKPIQRGSTKFWFSPDSRLLAYSTNVQFDGRINNDSLKLELYDLSSGTRLWSKPGFSRLNLGEPESLFSADGLSLRLRSQERIDCLTGAMSPKKSNAHATEIISHSVLQYGCDRVLQCRAVKDTDCWRKLQIVDADTDEVLAISEDLTWPHRSPYGYSPLPDGKHVARVRILEAQLEIWDVAGSKQVVSASGNFVTFSQDGRLCAVATREYQIQERTISAKSSAFDEVTIWDVRTSQPISKLSLSGDKADNAKFSPDGSRLLTLHGTQAKGTGGDVPSGRLWDIASGREIMSIPVADVNHYLWDLVFDPEGNQLTSLVYAKSAGTAGGLGATTFDATPLLSASEIATAMRVTGWGASWSPDGRKIVRNKKRDADESNDLEIIDLDTGDTQSLCKGGVDPYWSPVPGGPIAFVRGPEGKRRDLQNETVWLIEADGSNLRKVADGGFPTITRDGSLYFRQQTAPSVYPLFRMELRADSTPKEIILGCPYPTVSFDGKKRAATKFTSGLLEVSSIENPKDTIEISIGGNNDGAAGWSPDGRYIAFGSWNTSRSGLWLIDLQEKKVRLLANAKLTMPRWSPDGTRIACDDRVKDEVLILDVAHLNLSAGLPKLP